MAPFDYLKKIAQQNLILILKSKRTSDSGFTFYIGFNLPLLMWRVHYLSIHFTVKHFSCSGTATAATVVVIPKLRIVRLVVVYI